MLPDHDSWALGAGFPGMAAAELIDEVTVTRVPVGGAMLGVPLLGVADVVVGAEGVFNQVPGMAEPFPAEDAFDFVDGAVGYHIASFEAIDLRDSTSSQWCPAMLTDGITATIGPVAEPYLTAFPKPHEFFEELIEGKCLVEAYYITKPFNSWQMLLVGDPLYKPFGN